MVYDSLAVHIAMWYVILEMFHTDSNLNLFLIYEDVGLWNNNLFITILVLEL